MTAAESHLLGHSLQTLFDDVSFQKLLKRFSQKCISWDEFLSLNLPPNISPLAMWEIMNRMSRYMGIDLPIPDLNDEEYWYRRTHELTDIIGIVTRACAPDSHLHRTMTAASSQHFLMNVRIPDAIAATRLDGLSLSVRDADSQLRLDRAPRNATERLVANTFNAIDHLPNLVGEPFSRDLFMHLRDRLLEGVDIRALETTRASLGTGLFEWPGAMTERFANRQMDYIAAYANHETGEYDHDVLRALILTDSFRFYRPLKEVSYQVGRLAAHLYALKHDLPVLGLLPISRVKLDWDEGHILPPRVSFDRTAYESLRIRAPGDLTSLQTLTAQLTLLALRIVEHYVSGWENWDRALRQTLKKDLQLNDRQRSILGRALRKPEAEFTLRYHKNNHGIAYPTARRDFLELVDKGYLTLQQRGKAFIFLPHYGLREMFTNQETLAKLQDYALDKSFLSEQAYAR
ncbi:hypothetical protein [Martelella alba]|uniref:Uncharacterized protein n=1 Tax=Martelella alba TaxID=2590451 RepID=A0ABY2SG73_9HYPH|nr:hypothetical protein [Martelella alba]TKI04100.1 hypothetical protein FCN80_19250 [Martelella alba]